MDFYIKNMVCHRCKLAVESEFKKTGLHPVNIDLGEVKIEEAAITAEQQEQLSHNLQMLGFELLDDKRKRMIEQIKTLIIQTIHYNKEQTAKNYSDFIAGKLHHDYSYLSKLFSDTEGLTIEQYIINQKIERVKELLAYDEKSLSEIAFETGYSSVAHLSSQFKKVTGFTTTVFKQSGIRHRKTLDDVG